MASTPVPDRYSRQVLFGGIGAEGQRAVMQARVAVVGCGGLGSLQAMLLVRAGVGFVRLIDRDFVEESNLQRQLLYTEDDARTVQPKAAAAARALRLVNSQVEIEGLVDDLTHESAARLLGGVDLILDATDNFAARYLLNDYAVETGTPWIYGACVASYGVTFTVVPGETACLRCVFESAPPLESSADLRHGRRAEPDRRRRGLAAGRRSAQARRRAPRRSQPQDHHARRLAEHQRRGRLARRRP